MFAVRSIAYIYNAHINAVLMRRFYIRKILGRIWPFSMFAVENSIQYQTWTHGYIFHNYTCISSSDSTSESMLWCLRCPAEVWWSWWPSASFVRRCATATARTCKSLDRQCQASRLNGPTLSGTLVRVCFRKWSETAESECRRFVDYLQR